MDLKRILLCGLVLAAASFAAHAASPMVEINMCYQKAGDDAVKIGACLEQESKLVQAEYKDAVERVTVVAKAWDKPNRNRTRWDKLMRANQAFDNFIKRECDFVKNTTKGSSTQENNAALACRINLYRMRTDMLLNGTHMIFKGKIIGFSGLCHGIAEINLLCRIGLQTLRNSINDNI